MPYTPQTWTDGAGGGTPVNATRLTAMETGIGAAANTGGNSPAAHGISAWSYDPVGAVNSSIPTLGTVYLTKIVNPPADTITKIYWHVNVVGVTATAGQNFVGLYDSSGTRLATTGVDADVTATAGLRTTTISGQLLTPGAFYWVGMVFNAATGPTLARAVSGSPGVLSAHVGLTAATYRFATSSTSQTSLPTSITPSSNAAANFQLWVAVGP